MIFFLSMFCSFRILDRVHWTSNFLQGTRKTRPCITGDPVQEAGVPDGVYNVVQGEGDTGAALSQHQGLDKLSFTG